MPYMYVLLFICYTHFGVMLCKICSGCDVGNYPKLGGQIIMRGHYLPSLVKVD